MEHQIRIAVCDSIAADRDEISGKTKNNLGDAGINCQIFIYKNGQSLLSAIEDDCQFHILLLDVLLEDMSGLEIAASLRRQQNQAEIIFISANREFAILGYEVSAARYLTKPLSEEKLQEALLHCCRNSRRHEEILLPTDQGYYFTRLAEILYVEAYDRGTKFFLSGDTVVTRMKFKEAENLLCPSGFMLSHRSYLVNLSKIKYIRHYEIELKDGRTVPIGKARYSQIRRKYMDINAE